MELERSQRKLREQGFGLAAISYDSIALLENFAARRKITFPLLSDPDSKIIKAFGVLNDKVPQAGMSAGIPYPGTFIVNHEGRVQAKYFEEDYRQRYTVAGILADRFGQDFSTVKSAQATSLLRLTASASEPAVRGGQHLTLTLEVQLNEGLHVYAPGVKEDYIPISWDVVPSGGWKAGAPAFPESKKEKLAGDPDLVPAYEGRFRITRELVLAPEAILQPMAGPNGEFVVKGSFRYQACTERWCYPPETVPLEWKFQLEGHDRERVPVELRRK